MRRNRERLAVFLLHNLGQQLHLLAQFIDRQAQTAERLAQTLVEPVASPDATNVQTRKDAYVPGQPPTHWLQRVRQDAPHLLEPREEETTRGSLTRWSGNKSDIPGSNRIKRDYLVHQLESRRINITAEFESGKHESIERVDDEPLVEEVFSANNAQAPKEIGTHQSIQQPQEGTDWSEAAARNDPQFVTFRELPISYGHQAVPDALIKPIPLRPFTPPTQSAELDWQPINSTQNRSELKPVVQAVSNSPKPGKVTNRPVWSSPEAADGSRQNRTDEATALTQFPPQIAAAPDIQRETAVSEPGLAQKPAFIPEHQPSLATPSHRQFTRNDDAVTVAEDRTTSSDYQPAGPHLETETEFVPPLVENSTPFFHTEQSNHFKSNANSYSAVREDLEQDWVSQSRAASPPTQLRQNQNHQVSWSLVGQSRPNQSNDQPDTHPPTKHQPLLIESEPAECHKRWPLLATAESSAKETGEQIWQTWKRRQRLNREQRGFEWNG